VPNCESRLIGGGINVLEVTCAEAAMDVNTRHYAKKRLPDVLYRAQGTVGLIVNN